MVAGNSGCWAREEAKESRASWAAGRSGRGLRKGTCRSGRKLGPLGLSPETLFYPVPFLPQSHGHIAVRVASGARQYCARCEGETAVEGTVFTGEGQGLPSVVASRNLAPSTAPAGAGAATRHPFPHEQPELGALPQPEFPPRLRDLLMLLCAPPGGGRFSTTSRGPASFHSGPRASHPQRLLPAASPLPPPLGPLLPPPSRRVNGVPAARAQSRGQDVTKSGVKREQGARRQAHS